MQDCSISIAYTLEILQSCTKPSICPCMWIPCILVASQWSRSGCSMTCSSLPLDQRARSGVDLLQRLHWRDSLVVIWPSDMVMLNIDMAGEWLALCLHIDWWLFALTIRWMSCFAITLHNGEHKAKTLSCNRISPALMMPVAMISVTLTPMYHHCN